MKITVLDSVTLGSDISPDSLSEFGKLTVYSTTAPCEVTERICDTDIIVTNKVKLSAAMLSQAKKLKLICVTATGYDNIDTSYCAENGIAVCNIAGYSTDSVAQVTVALALSLICHIPEYTDFVNSGAYTASGFANRLTPVYHETSALTWGVIGLGSIGRKVARIASALGCRVAVNRQKASDSEFECVPLDSLLSTADIVSVHTPLTDKTKNLLNREKLSLMKPTAVLVNVARGAVTDESAVAEFIKSGRLGGFGCDVYSSEPLSDDSPIRAIASLPNVILTPHMAWGAYEARKRCISETAENIRSFISGGRRSRIV